MTAKSIDTSIDSIFPDIWVRHATNLKLAIQALLYEQRVGVAALGRAFDLKTTPKHAIKRIDRFLRNHCFDDPEAQEQLLHTVIGPRREVLITVDWTKIRSWFVLVAGVVQRGRSVAIQWSVMDPNKLYKSMNAFENGFFIKLAAALPPGVRATVLLDRGFKRVDLMPVLQRCKLDYVIRSGGNVTVKSPSYKGRADALVRRRGMVIDMPDAELRPSRPVQTRIIGIWDRGQKEPWILATNRADQVRVIVRYYARRFRIEEMFRDKKDHRFGLYLGYLLMHKAGRLERMLLIVALTHFIAMLVGAYARSLGKDRVYRANTGGKATMHSDFTLGLYYWRRIPWRPRALLLIFHAYREEDELCAIVENAVVTRKSRRAFGG